MLIMVNCVNCDMLVIYNIQTGELVLATDYVQIEKKVYCSGCYNKLSCKECNGINEHSDSCSSCFEYVRHKNLKDGLCRYCRMRTEDPDSYAEAKHFGYISRGV